MLPRHQDLRKAQPCDCYAEVDFDVPVGKTGDCFARYLVRMERCARACIMLRCIRRCCR